MPAEESLQPPKVRRGRPPGAASKKRKRGAGKDSAVETNKGFLVKLSQEGRRQKSRGKSVGDTSGKRQRAKKKPTRFGDMVPNENTFPQTGQVSP
jgi:hypothetical protein